MESGQVEAGLRAQAQSGWVVSHQKISDTQGGFTGLLDVADLVGTSVAALGDLDFDGDGNVGAFDLLTLLVNWGPCP